MRIILFLTSGNVPVKRIIMKNSGNNLIASLGNWWWLSSEER
jgi:hypothetical protein